MYHYIKDFHNTLFKNIKGLDVEDFQQQLAFFAEHFHVLSMEEVIATLRKGKTFAPRSMLLTFDDGYLNHYTAAYPLLKKYHMQGSFFIPAKILDTKELLNVNKIHLILANTSIDLLAQEVTALLARENIHISPAVYTQYANLYRYDDEQTVYVKYVLQNILPKTLRSALVDTLFTKFITTSESELADELYMNRTLIKSLQDDGMYIGCHGYEHDRLGIMPPQEMAADIDRSLDLLEEFLQPGTPWVMNYPYGNASHDVIAHIVSRGACLAVTTEARIAQVSDNKYLLPRLDCNDFPPKSTAYTSQRVRRAPCMK